MRPLPAEHFSTLEPVAQVPDHDCAILIHDGEPAGRQEGHGGRSFLRQLHRLQDGDDSRVRIHSDNWRSHAFLMLMK